jgi:hypothetical protein
MILIINTDYYLLFAMLFMQLRGLKTAVVQGAVTALTAFGLKTDSDTILLTKFLQFLEKFVAVHYNFYRSYLSERQVKNVRNGKHIGYPDCIVDNCHLCGKRDICEKFSLLN